MAGSLAKRIARRALRGAGLAPLSDVEHARRAAAKEARTEARSRRDGDRNAVAARVRELEAQAEARREQDLADHAERSTLRKALAFHWQRLDHLEAIYGTHAPRLAMQLQMALAGRALEPSAEELAHEARLAAVCHLYSEALARGADAPMTRTAREVSIGGAVWRVPAAADDGKAPRLTLETCLPLDALAVSRQFAVGGVMLDIGAEFGATSIPRALLGDFARVYAAEGDDEAYPCLVRNVAASRVRGVVLPDHVAIGRDQTLEAWLHRLQVPIEVVRFVRVGESSPVLKILQAGLEVFVRRDVVWQVDLAAASPLMTGEGFQELGRLIGRHFTHFKELGLYPAEEQRRAAEAKHLFKRNAPRPSGLLLFNLR
jgi:hypothetical protein